ncbi:MAG TPA: hypothetical protein PKX48_06360 [Planctomycetota bacterium]|nr:hypothetical protein [Planctomycetota bacterium]HNR99675.1 hypothetical protein [Planctomycetota bacterium]HNU25197.1 hypothetical protein [Planctomycetota bacterium]HOE30564.1 hypothetical protein [Planctomycetota bacterium]HOE86774.1 hypothetical protein [Planctomycetota bacterium]
MRTRTKSATWRTASPRPHARRSKPAQFARSSAPAPRRSRFRSRLAAAIAAALPLAAAPERAFITPEARWAGDSCAWFALAIEAGGAAVLPHGLAPERLAPGGECYVQAEERLAVPSGEFVVTARYGRWRSAPERVTLAPGQERRLAFSLVPPPLPAAARELIVCRGELPPIFVARAEQCELDRVPAGARGLNPAAPAFDGDGVWIAPPEVAVAAIAAPYLAALARGLAPLVLLEPAARAGPDGWNAPPAARRTVLAGRAGEFPALAPGGAGFSDGPSLVLAVGRDPAAGQTIAIDSAARLRVRAAAWDPAGVTRLELLHGASVILSSEAPEPKPVLRLDGEASVASPGVLIARAFTARGAEAVSGFARVALAAPPAAGAIAPLADWTSPRRGFELQFRVTASEDLAGTLFARAGEGARLAPPEMPIALRRGDALTLGFILALPERREFTAALPVTLATAAGELWQGAILVAPWDLDALRPEGVPAIARQETRLGYKLGAVTVRALKTAPAPRALVLDVFADGRAGAAVKATLAGLPPRRAVTLSHPLPPRRGWHVIELDPEGYRIAAGATIAIEAGPEGTALLGGVRILE